MNTKLITVALSEYGTTEEPGDVNNPEVMKYYHETGRTWVNSEETPWCDAFADWIVMTAGGRPTPGLNARAWLEAGEAVEFPQQGDVVILWRDNPDSKKGHVGFYIRETDKMVWILGGNQSNQVKISAYRKNRVLGYRRLWPEGEQEERINLSTEHESFT